MPHIKFTDSTLKTLTVDKTTWFTDPSCKGLRLCVTGGGTKTWYVNKWDPTSQKTRSVKLTQWANKGAHCRWAKDQVGKIAHDIATGNVLTRDEHEIAQTALGIPTFRDALEQYIEHRTTTRQSGQARMMESTAYDYRMSFNRHLARWANVKVDELPILEINQYPNTVQIDTPNAAHLAALVAAATVRFINRLCALALPIPSLLDGTRMKSRVQTGKLDMSVPWLDRKQEIDAIKNEHIRLAWMITWYTGFRGRGLRALHETNDAIEGTGVEQHLVLTLEPAYTVKRFHVTTKRNGPAIQSVEEIQIGEDIIPVINGSPLFDIPAVVVSPYNLKPYTQRQRCDLRENIAA